MNCKHCGAEVADGAKFCENCGNKIEIEETFTEPERVDAEVVREGIKIEQPEEETTFNAQDSYESASEPQPERVTESAIPGEPKGPIGFSIASLSCGILGLLCCCCGFFGAIISIAGVVLGIIAIKKNCEGQGMAIAGIVCGGIGALMAICALIIGGITGSLGDLNSIDGIGDLQDSLGNLLENL